MVENIIKLSSESVETLFDLALENRRILPYLMKDVIEEVKSLPHIKTGEPLEFYLEESLYLNICKEFEQLEGYTIESLFQTRDHQSASDEVAYRLTLTDPEGRECKLTSERSKYSGFLCPKDEVLTFEFTQEFRYKRDREIQLHIDFVTILLHKLEKSVKEINLIGTHYCGMNTEGFFVQRLHLDEFYQPAETFIYIDKEDILAEDALDRVKEILKR